ncbi:hypothetical protein OV079_18960 [Nannocystis pusilla]|uniref:Uncharacterized protein n=1 Tax=Nannocystis pusilla TaxID=889268 RepID=A0A9X3EPS0_9BACT|nr:hypothetical protein [Nannocystis pusilla]MCY1007591.1 hypothetical protein [Nannocystis pusilla]
MRPACHAECIASSTPVDSTGSMKPAASPIWIHPGPVTSDMR